MRMNREPVTIVKIAQPLCALEFGVAPCTASGTEDQKCVNTRATCLDLPNYDESVTLDLYFAEGHVADMGVPGAPYVFPALVSVSTEPTQINLGGTARDAQGLGVRATTKIVIKDFQHSDRLTDPYREGRSWDTLDGERGSFWSRWTARNRYRQNIQITVYEGYAGQALDDMVTRTYFWQRITREPGQVRIEGKDILSRIEERKAQAPAASPGILADDIDDAVTTFEVTGATVDDYPAAGTLRINDEVMTYTGRAAVTGGVEFTGVTRGTDNTEADEHEAEDAVQLCLRFSAVPAWQVVRDLMVNYGEVDASWLNLSQWQTLWRDYRGFFLLTHLVTAPTPVVDLIADVSEQCLVNFWWDERQSLVNMSPLRGIEDQPQVITDQRHIVAGSFTLREKIEERLTQVWVYFDTRNPVEDLDDEANFARLQKRINAVEEQAHGEASIRKVFAYWLPTRSLAFAISRTLLSLYLDNPSECEFTLDAKDRDLWVGDTMRISHHMDVDAFGLRRVRTWAIISARENHTDGTISYVARDVTPLGVVNFIMASGEPDYSTSVVPPFKSCYIGDASGLLSDGTEAGKIA